MPDLTRIQNSQPVQLVDATDLLVCDISTVAPTGTESGLIVRTLPSGTHTVVGTTTASPTGTYTVAGTTTAVPSGTYTVTATAMTVTGTGTTASPAAGILTVQGNANGVSIPITLQNLNYPSSTSNSSTSQLTAGATFTGALETIQNQQAAQVQIYSDQPFTVNIDQYVDNSTTYPSSTDSFVVATVAALGGYEFNMNISLPGNYFRLRVTNNGASTTTLLKIDTTFGVMATGPRTITLLGNNRHALMEINGTVVDTNTGSASAGTQRVVLASNQPTLTVAGTTTAVPSGTYTVDYLGSATSTLANVTVTNSVSIQLMAANSNRLLATFFNSGSNSVYIKWGAAASATSHTIELFSNGFYEMHVPVYTGAIEALSSTGTNIIRVTEI